MEIRLFNTLTLTKDGFVPVEGSKVRLYVCGPTVYDFIHIGNARVFVLFDAFRRFLEEVGFQVIFVQNFTDIDDKIIRRAQELGVSPKEVAERYIEEYWRDAEALGIKRATVHPRATEHIPEMIALIAKLEEKGFTYSVEGDILFDVSRFPEYGKLSKKKLDELQEGARVEVRYEKRNPADFVLWKGAKPGEPFWESPWGKGRPGWHIECSAMAMKYLGETLDIHAGGIDLVFPHHENEIAQSEAATGKPFVRYFLHNGYVTINAEKMSKSLGNIITVRELLKQYNPKAIRLALFGTHYRNPINIDVELLEASSQFLERMKNFLRNFAFIRKKVAENPSRKVESESDVLGEVVRFQQLFLEALADDFNTPQALGVFGEFMRFGNRYLLPSRGKWSEEVLAAMDAFLGIVERVLGIIPWAELGAEDREVQALVEEREKARKEKNFALADALRERIRALGYVVEDTPLGARFFRHEGREG
ncbi:MAG: cysteine--tRNA ligase [Candidatus Caldatribacterium sp.]|uniref:cysteine--tRNA ligase n=1 Tax=Candidatus Caldatribacterium sp. TaxID=2282143 RepID=UPI00299AB8E8|nr:cysteine--tRNA ligase [Candidatus Caldatribacterium sp.]MCX7729984.1 cysteine--tRNA ligase [Candidatus Caldatribacterium sp.]MDW8080312.1 cysteine--tRNA ligase [Candidatus Calescibacterium sp.]